MVSNALLLALSLPLVHVRGAEKSGHLGLIHATVPLFSFLFHDGAVFLPLRALLAYSACARDAPLARYALPRVVARTRELYSNEVALQSGAPTSTPASGTVPCLNRS